LVSFFQKSFAFDLNWEILPKIKVYLETKEGLAALLLRGLNKLMSTDQLC
jgi:hypothetical protein